MARVFTIIRLSDYAWFRIIHEDYILDIDPGYAGTWSSRLTPLISQTGKSDAILISHAHFDHVEADALAHLVKPATLIAANPLCGEAISVPFRAVIPGAHFTLGPLSVETLPAYNTAEGNSTRKAHHHGEVNAYLITWDGIRIFFAADTDIIPEMAKLGPVDLAFLPIGGTYTMDQTEAARATMMIHPRIVIPMHELGQSSLPFIQAITTHKQSYMVLRVGEKGQVTF